MAIVAVLRAAEMAQGACEWTLKHLKGVGECPLRVMDWHRVVWRGRQTSQLSDLARPDEAKQKGKSRVELKGRS